MSHKYNTSMQKKYEPPINKTFAKFLASGIVDYAYSGKRKFPIDLSLAINPLGCSELVKEMDVNSEFSSYPEVESESLIRKIEEVYNIPPEKVAIGPGASRLLELAILTFLNRGDEIIIPLITFPLFRSLAIMAGAKLKFIHMKENFDLDYAHLAKILSSKTKMVILCNPNNPTGRSLDKKLILQIIRNHPHTLFLIDEANIDFGGEPLLLETLTRQNLLVIRSFSKGFGLAGLRIGFIVGASELVQLIKKRAIPFSVNAVAQKVAHRALDDLEFLERSRKFCHLEREYLRKNLEEIGFKCAPSDSNFLLVDISRKFDNSSQFIEELNKQGAQCVDGKSFPDLGDKYVRLSPRDHHTNEKFINIVRKICRAR